MGTTTRKMMTPRIKVASLSAVMAILLLSWGLASSQASGGAVRSCKAFVISKYHDENGVHRFRAWGVRRSSDLRCSMTRKLIKAAYATGPLKVIRRVFEGGSGRPTYWLKNGWRCGNGAGGASCYNADRPVFNDIEYDGIQLAVSAATG